MTLRWWGSHACKTAQPAGQEVGFPRNQKHQHERGCPGEFVLGIEWHDRKIIINTDIVLAIGIETPSRPEG